MCNGDHIQLIVFLCPLCDIDKQAERSVKVVVICVDGAVLLLKSQSSVSRVQTRSEREVLVLSLCTDKEVLLPVLRGSYLL